MVSRLRRRTDQIKIQVPITQVLADYGYPVRPDAGDREIQFPCDLHGDGRDGKPSARAYPDSASFYCFACDRSRDAVELVRIKEQLGFKDAVAFLEKRYKLPAIPWTDEDDVPFSAPVIAEDPLQRPRTFAKEAEILANLLGSFTYDRMLAQDTLLTFWEALDRVSYMVGQEQLSESKGMAVVSELKTRIMKIWIDGDHDDRIS